MRTCSYIMSMAVSDYSGQAWLQGFNDIGEHIFGMPANDLLTIKAKGEGEYNAVISKACGHTYNFSCRAKQDIWKVTNF
jgi:replication factor A1